jgi:hypothetical protein
METEIKEQESNIKFEDIKKEVENKKNSLICENCGKIYKSRGSLWKHKQKCGKPKDVKQEAPQEESKEEIMEEKPVDLDYLRDRLKKLMMNNPNIDLTRPPKMIGDFALIDKMTKEELEVRILEAQRHYAYKVDTKIAEAGLDVSAMAIGHFLNCTEELKQEIAKDKLLLDSTSDLLGYYGLMFIPLELKVSGLLSLNVLKAKRRAMAKQQQEVVIIDKPAEEQEVVEVEHEEKPEVVEI